MRNGSRRFSVLFLCFIAVGMLSLALSATAPTLAQGGNSSRTPTRTPSKAATQKPTLSRTPTGTPTRLSDEALIATYVAGTLGAIPTFTPSPTLTLTPSLTPSITPSPTPTVNTIGTAVAATVGAALTKTAALVPTNTVSPLVRTISRTPSRTPTRTPTMDVISTLAARATQMAAQGTPTPTPTLPPAAGIEPGARRLYGPAAGRLVHNPSDNRYTIDFLPATASDFLIDMTVVNPYGSEEGAWDFSIVFRFTFSSLYALVFDSGGQWWLYLNEGEQEPELIQRGRVRGIKTGEEDTNQIRLQARGSSGQVFINGQLAIETLDIRRNTRAGEFAVMIGFFDDTEMIGKITRYTGLSIWALPELTATPTNTATRTQTQRPNIRASVTPTNTRRPSGPPTQTPRAAPTVIGARPTGEPGLFGFSDSDF